MPCPYLSNDETLCLLIYIHLHEVVERGEKKNPPKAFMKCILKLQVKNYNTKIPKLRSFLDPTVPNRRNRDDENATYSVHNADER
jgi:hypothetical protein